MPDRGVFADFHVIIDVNEFMDQCAENRTAAGCGDVRQSYDGPLRLGLCRRSDARVSTLSTRKSFPTIRARSGSDLDAIKEMLALRLQRLARLQPDAMRTGLMGRRYAVPPVDPMREQQEASAPMARHRRIPPWPRCRRRPASAP